MNSSMDLTITDVIVKDLRFPTSKNLQGSDAMNKNPDYSAAYIIIKTTDSYLEGHGLTFTIGRGNEICVAAIKALSYLIIGKKLSVFTNNMGDFAKYINSDSQLRWLGPEKGVIHLASAAIVNGIWDLWAKQEKKPLWLLVAGMSSDQIIRCIDFSYIQDVITPEESLEMIQRIEKTKNERIQTLYKHGYQAYSTSAGWLGFSDKKLVALAENSIRQGWKHLKLKVGLSLEDDVRRARIVRHIIGEDCKLMFDANQKWNVDEAITWISHLKQFNPYWIEEPTSPDDILGHKKIKEAIYPIKVATGEHCQNRIMFKQFIQSKAIDFCQIDSCRLAGVNEVLSVMLMAAKFNIPVCPHAGGVGLCEYVQHLSIIDYVAISGSMENRIIEYVDELHNHFITPVKIRQSKYIAPCVPGYSIQIKDRSLADYEFPYGIKWRQNEN